MLARGEIIDADDLTLSTAATAGDTGGRASRQSAIVTSSPRRWPTSSGSTFWPRSTSTGWNKSQTASILGIERSTLDRKIRRYELSGLRPK